MQRRLLLIEDVPSDLTADLLAGSDAGTWAPERMGWSEVDPEHLAGASPDLLVPVAVPDVAPALELFRWTRDHPLRVPILAVVPERTDPDHLHLIAESASDFVLWPVRGPEWRQRIDRLLRSELMLATEQARLLDYLALARLVGRDPAFLRAVEDIPRIGKAGYPVLITGETGTGKELCARAIHFAGRRRDLPFIPIDCASIPDSLIENELFGHARGAFTDARDTQRGLVDLANGGSLFLDEIDALSLSAQGKLLRFLQERRYRPLGSDRFLEADVNVIAASNQDVGALVQAKRFRADLFFRLNVLRIHLPPLRNRRGDISLLADHFVTASCAEAGIPRKTLNPATIRALTAMEWPGNVRELLNVMQRAVALGSGPQILPRDVITGAAEAAPSVAGGFREARSEALARFETEYVRALLHKHGGNITRAARDAGKDRRAFGRLVKKHHIDRRDV